MKTREYLAMFVSTFVVPFRAPSTVNSYRRAFASLPARILDAELEKLNAFILQAAINTQAMKHPRAAQLTFTTLTCAMRKAVDTGLLPRSPMQGCVKPVHHAAKAKVLDVDQLRAYLAAARSETCFPLLMLMAVCGLRRGEALGVRWSSIDLTTGTLNVEQQRMRINGQYLLCGLKTASSARSLPLPAAVVQELNRVKTRSFSGFLCDLTPEGLAKAHYRVIARAGVTRVTLHGLRHSMATAAAAQGCPMKVLQVILGHSKFELTANLYADHLSGVSLQPHLGSLSVCLMG